MVGGGVVAGPIDLSAIPRPQIVMINCSFDALRPAFFRLYCARLRVCVCMKDVQK